MSYNISKSEPNAGWITRQLEKISNETEASLSVNRDMESCNAKYTLQPPSGSGSLVVYKGDDPSIELSHENEPVDTSIDIEKLSYIDFDIRPEEDQFRVGTAGDKNLDFGIN